MDKRIGRPREYEPERHDKDLMRLNEIGITDAAIGVQMGFSEQTIQKARVRLGLPCTSYRFRRKDASDKTSRQLKPWPENIRFD